MMAGLLADLSVALGCLPLVLFLALATALVNGVAVLGGGFLLNLLSNVSTGVDARVLTFEQLFLPLSAGTGFAVLGNDVSMVGGADGVAGFVLLSIRTLRFIPDVVFQSISRVLKHRMLDFI